MGTLPAAARPARGWLFSRGCPGRAGRRGATWPRAGSKLLPLSFRPRIPQHWGVRTVLVLALTLVAACNARPKPAPVPATPADGKKTYGQALAPAAPITVTALL